MLEKLEESLEKKNQYFSLVLNSKKSQLLFCSHSKRAAGPQLAKGAINKYRNRYINK